MTAAAGAVNHALHATFAAGDDRHHESIVADGDELFLQCAIRLMRAQETLQRFFDQAALPLHIAAQPTQCNARVIGQRPVGKNLAA